MKVGITFSSFDLLHAGHVMMLKEAKKQCDYLIVGLQLDPSLDRSNKNAPSQSIIERYIQLKGSKYVDEIKKFTFLSISFSIFTLILSKKSLFMSFPTIKTSIIPLSTPFA